MAQTLQAYVRTGAHELLGLMQDGMAVTLGANQTGFCYTNGIGHRTLARTTLHVDANFMGLSEAPPASPISAGTSRVSCFVFSTSRRMPRRTLRLRPRPGNMRPITEQPRFTSPIVFPCHLPNKPCKIRTSSITWNTRFTRALSHRRSSRSGCTAGMEILRPSSQTGRAQIENQHRILAIASNVDREPQPRFHIHCI